MLDDVEGVFLEIKLRSTLCNMLGEQAQHAEFNNVGWCCSNMLDTLAGPLGQLALLGWNLSRFSRPQLLHLLRRLHSKLNRSKWKIDFGWGEKASKARVEKQQTEPICCSFKPVIEPETHNWWRANAQTTEPTQRRRKNWEMIVIVSILCCWLAKGMVAQSGGSSQWWYFWTVIRFGPCSSFRPVFFLMPSVRLVF